MRMLALVIACVLEVCGLSLADSQTAHATGTFDYSTGLVLYDVSVDYATWMPTKIEVWAAPTGTSPLIAPSNEILEEPPPAIPTPTLAPH